jgi:hypothetical protein
MGTTGFEGFRWGDGAVLIKKKAKATQATSTMIGRKIRNNFLINFSFFFYTAGGRQ